MMSRQLAIFAISPPLSTLDANQAPAIAPPVASIDDPETQMPVAAARSRGTRRSGRRTSREPGARVRAGEALRDQRAGASVRSDSGPLRSSRAGASKRLPETRRGQRHVEVRDAERRER